MCKKFNIEFLGKYGFDKENTIKKITWNKTFSVGIFKWELKKNGNSIKKSKALIRVYGNVDNKDKVFDFCENIVNKLNSGTWDGRKFIKVK